MEEQEKIEEKNEKQFLKVIIIFFIIVLLFFLFVRSMGLIDHKPKIPTGNVDVFDIIFESHGASSVEVFDEDIYYSKDTKLNIFTKPSYYVLKNKIAPGSENTYEFVVRNNRYNIKYNLVFTESNEFNVNMKYKLKLNDKYIAGDEDHYVSYQELNRDIDCYLTENSYDVYKLEWKWVENENDTKVGERINAYYQLNLKIGATLVSENGTTTYEESSYET